MSVDLSHPAADGVQQQGNEDDDDDEMDDFDYGEEWKELSEDFTLSDYGSIENLDVYKDARNLAVDILKWAETIPTNQQTKQVHEFIISSLKVSAKLAGGYSFGAFLLLKHAEKVNVPALLIAPFFAYTAEANLGGKVRQVQDRYLARWLRREPCAAFADFYQRAGLGLSAPEGLPYELDDLAWGLEQLAREKARPRLPNGWTGIVGDRDPLLDATTLVATEPKIRVIQGVGHHPAALLEAVAGGTL
jgi:hypothetical protein